MTIAINVKGYVNGDDWGAADVGPSLLTYEEVVAMATNEGYSRANTVAALNQNASYYYDTFNSENHIYADDCLSMTDGGTQIRGGKFIKNIVHQTNPGAYGNKPYHIYYYEGVWRSDIYTTSVC